MNKYFDKKSIADEVEKLFITFSKDSIQEKMESQYKVNLIQSLEIMGHNEHLIESVKLKGIPKFIFCSEDMYSNCSLFRFCEVRIHTLLEPKSVIFSW